MVPWQALRDDIERVAGEVAEVREFVISEIADCAAFVEERLEEASALRNSSAQQQPPSPGQRLTAPWRFASCHWHCCSQCGI